ncbi:hypothetical protein M8A51_25870 [Schlegelella sp. S2-27]|uniref:YD repeat-containing protein n=1 Tax=Caldimonas mangrovi TaxID=2944811 RepID=A0ABT0YW46_9BURK|nr:hypothetical protein [Caldimonas mangrovi]MCM5682965.1 hypothetical protein [Caldimonas mangrovi]
MRAILGSAILGKFVHTHQPWRHGAAVIALAANFLTVPLDALAQDSACAANAGAYPDAICSVADVFYRSRKDQSPQFETGTEACIHAAGNLYGTWYRNAEFVAWHPSYGRGCYFDIYTNGTQYSGRLFYQNWAYAVQECRRPPVEYRAWTDRSDTSVDGNGRLWCVYCPSGTRNIGGGVCAPEIDVHPPRPRECGTDPGFGQPIYPLTGTKRKLVAVETASSLLATTLAYDTAAQSRGAPDLADHRADTYGALGKLWTTNWHRRLVLGKEAIQAVRGSGNLVSFSLQQGGEWRSTVDQTDSLVVLADQYFYRDQGKGSIEQYESSGRLVKWQAASGSTLTYTYSTSETAPAVAPGAGYLLEVADPFERRLSFTYAQLPSGRVAVTKIEDHVGKRWELRYDGQSNLAAVIPPGSSDPWLGFAYDSGHPGQSWALTGMVDAFNVRTESYEYDEAGQAKRTQLHGGFNQFSVAYSSPPVKSVREVVDGFAKKVWRYHEWTAPQGTSVRLPNGAVLALEASSSHGQSRLTSMSQPAGAGCAASTHSTEYGTQGNVVRRDDFTGKRTCYVHDLSRHLATTRVEGLSPSDACSTYTATAASLPAGSRKTSIEWHPDWRFETRVAEPGRITTTIFNGQPDPFSGGAVASCAPSSALLTDGKPIAVACKRVEQATTDANGSQGFSASLAAGVPARTWTYTYNQHGQVLTEDGPRTDVADVTTYEYYPDTTPEWTRGDLKEVTNAAGQVTRYTRYNPHGQVLQSVDANGVITDSTYDLRQRLTSVTVAGQTTTYTYEPTGLLKRVTQPDASYVEYHYDDAHRLTGLSDQAGNTITYTLDNAGNRTAEQVTDPEGVLARNLSRAFDALGRVQQSTGSIQ